MFQLHRVVVPSGSGAAAVPQPEHHDLRVARLAAGHGESALFPPQAAISAGLPEWLMVARFVAQVLMGTLPLMYPQK